MPYVMSGAAFFILSLALGVLWTLILFKQSYDTAVGPMFLAKPIFPLGLFAIALNAVVHLSVFSWVYPLGEHSWLRALTIVGTVWGAHFVNTIGTAAKYDIAHRRRFLGLELGFSALNVVVLGTALWALLGGRLVPGAG